MKKVVYDLKKIQELILYLDGIQVSGIENFKRLVLCTSILEVPIEEIEEEDKEGE